MQVLANALKLLFGLDYAVRTFNFVNVRMIAFSCYYINLAEKPALAANGNIYRNRVILVFDALTQFNNVAIVFS